MRPDFRRSILRPLPIVLIALAASPAPEAGAAAPIRLLSADDRGLTLEVEVAGERVTPSDAPGRQVFHVPGFAVAATPGRPEVPYATTLIALPPGARTIVRVIESSAEEVRTDLLLPIAGRPGVRAEPEGLGAVPFEDDVAPILDGAWPAERATLGEPFVLRRQRMAALAVWPVTYDEATGRLALARRMTVRVDFVGGAAPLGAPAADDRYWEPVLEGALLNYDQGRRMRVPRGAAGARAPAESGFSPRSLLDRPLPGDAAFDRGPAGPAAAAAFDEDAPEVRIHVDTTGFYAFQFAELSAKGFPAGVPVAEVALHRHEPVAGAVAPAPSYETIELPIEVRDANGNGVFDGGDAILAYVQNWAERTGASIHMRNWGDAEVVYATRKTGGAGLRMATRSGWRGQAGLTPLGSYPQRRLWERNFQYMTAYFVPFDTAHVDPFHWTNLATYYNRPDSIAFEINDLDTTQTATVRINWVGREATAHYLFARVTARYGQPSARVTWVADSSNAFWSGRQPFTRTATIPGGALSEGTTNRIGIWGKRGGGAPDPVTNALTFTGFNWFEVAWWRRFAAIRGYLECSGDAGSGEIEVVATGFADSSRLRAYDVTDPQNPVRLAGVLKEPDGGGWRLRLQDSTAAGAPRRYAIADAPKSPASSRYSSVTRRRLFDRASGDYLIVVPEAFLSAVPPLEQHRAAQGLSVAVAPIEAVYDEFNGGRNSSYALRRYLRFAYENWDARFATFVGDGSEDPRNFTGTARPDWIPAHPIGGPVPFSTGSESAFERIPSDQWYGWCMTCDPADFQFAPKIPELFIGRLPVNSAQEAAATIAKVIGYESFAPDQLWRRKMLLLADDQYSGQSTFGGDPGSSSYCKRSYEDRFRLLSQTVRDVILIEAGLVESEPDVFDMGFWLRNEPIDPVSLPDSCRADRTSTQVRTRANVTPEMIARLNEGRLWWNYQGHSNEQEVAHEDIYRNLGSDDDKTKFTNTGRLFFFSGFSCHPNSFGRAYEGAGFGPAFGEELVTLPTTGAIATFGSTGYEIIPRNGIDHLNVELARALFADPPRDPFLGEGGARPVVGEVTVLSFLRWYPRSLGSPFEQGVGMSYTLLGDPASRLWIGPPQTALTANDMPAVDGAPIRLHTPGNAVSLEARLVSNVALASITVTREDSAGVDTLPPARYTITPSFPDTGAASRGGRWYEARLDTTLTPATFSWKFRTVDRYGIARTFEAAFAFTTLLRADGQTVNDGDPVSPTAALTLFVQSPSPLVPANDLTLTVNGVPVVFTATADPGDASGREWTLAWDHDPFPIDQYVVELSANGGATNTHVFRVEVGGSELRIANAFVFPNPFQDDAIGANFTFTLVSGTPSDVLIRVYTVNGKLVYERKERALAPGYHQLHWDGLDAEGSPLANGTYVYRLLAHNGASREMVESRLVKLRRPRRGTLESETPP